MGNLSSDVQRSEPVWGTQRSWSPEYIKASKPHFKVRLRWIGMVEEISLVYKILAEQISHLQQNKYWNFLANECSHYNAPVHTLPCNIIDWRSVDGLSHFWVIQPYVGSSGGVNRGYLKTRRTGVNYCVGPTMWVN